MNIIDKAKNNKHIYILAIKARTLYESIETNRLMHYNDKQIRHYISKLYYKHIGKPIDWDNIRSYTEKMQWEKLYDNNEWKPILSDKYRVRDWVKEKIGEDYLIPLLGVWDSFDQIDFDSLPNQFVLKVNNGSGTNIIVKDKNSLDIDITRARIGRWLKVDRSYINGFETHYHLINPKIIAEKLIGGGYELRDYKFMCFSGKVYYVWVDFDRNSQHKRNVYDLNWNLQPWSQFTYGNYTGVVQKPENFDTMVNIATVLSQGFSHVRVDLYNLNGKIYFGEMTFTNGSGFEPILPEKYNLMLGNLWGLKTK